MNASGGDGHDLPGSFGPTLDQVAIDVDDVGLILHLLVTFERLLQRGDLGDHQLALLTPHGTGAPEAAADLLMAQVVGEAIHALREQLQDD